MDTNQPTQWLSKEEAADYLGVSLFTIERYARDGKLPRYRLVGGKNTRYKREDVEALIVADPPHPQGD